MKTRKLGLLACFAMGLSLLTTFSFAQVPGVVRCYTDEQDAILRANNPQLESLAQFEQWIQSELAYNQSTGKIIGGVYQIPVVVHVIHNGEAVGTGTNVSYAAIQSQIDVLNEDFRKMFGTNGWNTNPVGADTQIEFCLAKRRPDGSAFPGGEDGVNRINRSTAGFTTPPYSTTYIDANIKTYTYNGGVPTATRGWAPDKYMNIWLCNISGGILGYAQFPQSPLGGMGCGTPAAATDGVVFLYNSIGKSAVTGYPAPYNEGRTATHEIGHWLGLRHIWGDGGCSVDDYCNDTPLAGAANYGCPSGTNSCTAAPDQGPDMIENYMDYTNDLCMHVFTNDQKQRMRAVLEGSPMRVSLINSDACTPPNTADASITDVFNPKGDHCPGPITPSVQLRNRGSNNLTSAQINYRIDNGTPVTFAWSGNLAPNASATVALPAFTTQSGNHVFIAYSTLPNGVIDPATAHDTSGISFAVSNGIMPNYTQDFEGTTFPPDVKWYIDNTNGDCFKWSPASGMSISGTYTNNIAQVPCYGNSSTSNEDFYTPIFLLPCNASAASLKFDVAYRRRTSTSNDQLIVQISTDCGATWSTVYTKSGNVGPNYLYQSATTTGSTEYFPTVAGDWRTETINLLSYVSGTSKQVRFRFRGVSANGNNIFIDNVKFEGTYPAEIAVDVTGNQVLDEGFYNFANTQVGGTSMATFTVSNTGTSNLILTNPITVTGTGFSLGTGFGTTTVAPGASTTFTVNFSPASAGNFTGNVSFATNDCDEGTFNFILNGTGIATPPIADFNASQTTICQGSTVTFTNTSQYAASYSWTFTGGTPSSSTATNPTITYNTPGTYAVTLVATNANGSDTETKNAYITVLNSSASALPLTEGFTGTFLPTGWTLVNANNSPTTWAKSTTVGRAPTAGNSMWFNNFAYNDADDDEVKIKPLNFSSLSAAQMTFDVAYARYNAGNFDGLEVLVSTNCGYSFTSVYSKSGSTLATAPDNTSAFVPTSAQWRTETIDLTAFINQPNVIISFKNLSGYGNNIYVDNINVTGTPVSSPPVASFTSTNPVICQGQTVSYTNTSTNSPTSYSWTFTGGTPSSSTQANPVVTYNTPGTYTVSMTATNGAGPNTVTMTNYVTVNPTPSAPTISAAGPTTFCSGGSVVLNSTAGTSYLWSNGATTPSITVTTAGTFTCQVTNASGCQSTASNSISVTVNPTPSAPTISAAGPTTFCSGGSVVLNSTAGTSYLWSNGATTPSITVTTAGTFTCQVTNASGCQSTASNSISVTVNPTPSAPTISAAGPTTFCSGGSVVLNSTAGTSYLWSNGATTSSITVTTAGTFTCQVTNASGCQSTASNSISVTVNPTPSAPTISAAGPTTFCSGGSVVLNSTAGTSYLWSNGATTSSITVTTAGTYTCQVTNASGCQSTASNSISVTVNPTPSAPTISAAGPTTFCSGGSVVLNSTAGTSYLWSNGATTSSITVTTAGTFTCQVTNASGCQSTASNSISVTVNPTPSAPTISAAGPTTFCSGGSVVLNSTAGTSYLWSNGATTPSITVTTAGTFTCQVTNASGCQSTASNSISVTVNPTPTLSLGSSSNPSACGSNTGSVTLSGTGTGTLSWSGAATGSTAVSTFPTTVSNLGAGSYTFVMTSGAGCTSSSVAVGLTDPGAPTPPVITASSLILCQGGSVDLTSSYSTGNSWSTGGSSQTISVTSAGTYTVSVTVLGCTSSSSPVTITSATPFTVDAGIDTSICEGESITLTGSAPGGITLSWNNGVNDGVSFVPINTNTYTLTGTDVNACESTDQITVTVNALPNVSQTPLGMVCDYNPVFTLTGGSPTGGSYSGTGVTAGQFDPSIGVGTYTITYQFTDANGCSASAQSSIVVDPCLAVGENKEEMISLHPNPSSGKVWVSTTSTALEKASLYDEAGRLLKEFTGQELKSALDLSDLSNGQYVLKVQTQLSTKNMKLVINR
jgi:PKD repeat protein